MTGHAYLFGPEHDPILAIPHTRARVRTGQSLSDWVRALPGWMWIPQDSEWWVDGLGVNAQAVFTQAGLRLDVSAWEGPPFRSLDELTRPWVLPTSDPDAVVVRPRLGGPVVCARVLGGRAVWDRQERWFRAPRELVVDGGGRPHPHLIVDPRVTHPTTRPASPPGGGDAEWAGQALARSVGSTDADGIRAHQWAVEHVGAIPDWFGLDLYPYQQHGAYAAMLGHRLIADTPGLGKTRTALAAHALTGTTRGLYIVPPIVLTHWAREIDAAGLAALPPTTPNVPAPPPNSPAAAGARIALFAPGRKPPDLPDAGAVVVADSLLAARPALVEEILEWGPRFVVYDEAHRARTWDAKRSTVIRRLATDTPGATRLALTGTPMFRGNPTELLTPVAFTGHLASVFGSKVHFEVRYTRTDSYGNTQPRTDRLGELRDHLNRRVWVRRHREDVLPDMPDKQWHTHLVDVNLTQYRQAHREVIDKIIGWVLRFEHKNGRPPTVGEREQWAKGNLGLVSPLRKAAGEAKIDAAAEWISRHEEKLVVWCHHHTVMDALGARFPDAGRIDGTTSLTARTQNVDDFQTGDMRVLICQITAAGVGITLTSSSTALFAETDWSPPLVRQAEDRIMRIGQTQTCTYVTMVAADTLDEHIVKVRYAKEDLANEVTDTSGRTTRDTDWDTSTSVVPAQIVAFLLQDAMDMMRGGYRPNPETVAVGVSAHSLRHEQHRTHLGRN